MPELENKPTDPIEEKKVETTQTPKETAAPEVVKEVVGEAPVAKTEDKKEEEVTEEVVAEVAPEEVKEVTEEAPAVETEDKKEEEVTEKLE